MHFGTYIFTTKSITISAITVYPWQGNGNKEKVSRGLPNLHGCNLRHFHFLRTC